MAQIKLSREDMMIAIRDGVAEGMPRFTRDEFHHAIATGVTNAIWQIVNHGTHMPCADFYDFIKQGVEDAIVKLGHKG